MDSVEGVDYCMMKLLWLIPSWSFSPIHYAVIDMCTYEFLTGHFYSVNVFSNTSILSLTWVARFTYTTPACLSPLGAFMVKLNTDSHINKRYLFFLKLFFLEIKIHVHRQCQSLVNICFAWNHLHRVSRGCLVAFWLWNLYFFSRWQLEGYWCWLWGRRLLCVHGREICKFLCSRALLS